ncbi:DUF4145 domain-containing protein [Candidatus Manganitrophus noduliformans]|uniref:DUF4145 domain-containing protein n=1 Tax=Candidatus Manganitrophus noduliformans TaxID=2606439 RepID=A0A7X6ICS2_9BACT|nr:DUF4145 domain-containing protein [Candidatus Manganitrophus noduliformans]NKE72846.1 DUF4145 domain-containing protein [Candidatus Manganitrophus noduliformans]
MNRNVLKLPFILGVPPDWICPTCTRGVLRIKKASFFKEERYGSRNRSQKDWDPEWIEYVYSCLLICTNDQCQEVVANTGIGSLNLDCYEDENGKWVQEYHDLFRPKFFEPHLILLDIPEKCPESVSSPLHESFTLFFSVPNAASNNVRIAIEELLTHLKVKRFNIIKGKRRFISLHQRIYLLPPKYAHLKDLILAIKWLGNSGSHGNGDAKGVITMDDVMDSYDLIEHILHEIYAPKTKKLVALAKKVNKRKGRMKVLSLPF